MNGPTPHHTLLLVTATLLVTGCAIRPTSVSVERFPQPLQELAGAWEGQYTSLDGDVLASISFRLEPGGEVAEGDVLILPRWDPDALDAGTGVGALAAPPSPLLLRVEFVRSQADTIQGRLEPYRDPACCMVYMEFQGVIEGDRIRGRFRTWPSGGDRGIPLQEGSWQMIRTSAGL